MSIDEGVALATKRAWIPANQDVGVVSGRCWGRVWGGAELRSYWSLSQQASGFPTWLLEASHCLSDQPDWGLALNASIWEGFQNLAVLATTLRARFP